MQHKLTLDRTRFNRRRFLRTVAATSTAFAVPWTVPASVFGAHAPSNRIHVGCIGAGNQTTVDLPAFLRNKDVQLVAICDVNRASYGYRDDHQYLGWEPQQKFINAFYAGETGNPDYRGCAAYRDFREVLARDDIDVVMLVVPDQWHAYMTVAACRAGKDVYCEKPLSLTVHDGQIMIQAVRKYQRILQTGSQYRSSPEVRKACELVLNGRIGEIKTIHTQIALNNKIGPGPGWEPAPVPERFDYPMWLGPAPDAPYHPDRCLYRFRFILDYSGGQITNFGAHSNDIAQWGHGSSLSGPVEFEPVYAEYPPEGSLFTTAEKSKFIARYADGVELICETGQPGFGCRFEGTEGWVEFGYGGLTTNPETLKDSEIQPQEIHLPHSVPPDQLSGSRDFILDHVRNFLNAVKTRQDPIEPVEVGHRTASLCHIGNIALKLNRTLRWDPEREVFPDDTQANELLRRPMRGPWEMPDV